MKIQPFKPTREQVAAAYGKGLPDTIAPNLKILFAGINPGLYTAAIGHHFGRPGNRFWPALFSGGFTPRLFDPSEKRELLKLGYGITNIVDFATAKADELSRNDLIAGAKKLARKVKKYKPKIVAVLGVMSYRIAFNNPLAQVGLQKEKLEEATVWVLPNPSGLNAHYLAKDLKKVFSELHRYSEKSR